MHASIAHAVNSPVLPSAFPADRAARLPAQWHGFVERQARERTAELRAMHAGRYANRMGAGEAPLAGYLFGRALRGGVPQGATLTRLRLADRTRRQTQSLLWRGRGNVATDLARSSFDAFHRVHAARTVGADPEVLFEEEVALAIHAGAGNCEESGRVAAFMHVPRMRPDESVHLVQHAIESHAWAEVRHAGGRTAIDDVIIDAWAEGPAVLRADAAYAKRVNAIRSIVDLGPDYGLMPFLNVQDAVDAIRAGNHLQQAFAFVYEEARRCALRPEPESIWQPEPVLDRAMHEAIADGLAGTGLHKQLLAIHVARAGFDMSIRPAIAAAPGILSAAQALAQPDA
ncbi:hypothetical protein E4K72_10255 [Oxalobacteraceae bacterium OM1]|nr:hypothetical protein E4K72_10255 [Oxalobacteraceae bacterium OM1]